MKHTSLFLLLLCLGYVLLAQRTVIGRVIDDESEEALAFATVGFRGLSIGSVTNNLGEFAIRIPEELLDSNIVVSYLGYTSVEIPARNLATNEQQLIRLERFVMELDELVIRPLSPEEYIKRAVRKYPENYAMDPFRTQGYYREKFTENGRFINMVEGIFDSYYPGYQDTLDNQHQLVLFRRADDLQDMAFMRDFIEKQQRKEKKKAEKKGEEYSEEDISEEIREGFGGPENILGMDLINGDEDCLDSTLFKKFRYSFGKGVNYMGRDLLIIRFETRNKVDHTRQKGKIFLDLESDAIVALEYGGEVVVPAWIRPFLFTFGLGIKNPTFKKKIRYQYGDGRWYPENFHWVVNLDLKKRHMFKTNEKSGFFIEQVFKINDVDLASMTEIPEDKRFDSGDPMEDQIYNDQALTWERVNIVKPEELSLELD